ncbi:MAG: RidA family protein [Proteobacteria bacterium]|jgi:2-iminobutanoate/2-iminopropanoate deaminase|nr:RidA family protein [Pseudomonadota bacterium]
MTKSVVETTNAPAAIGPYSQAVRAGSLLFVSGQIPLDPKSGQLVAGGIEAETRQVLENLRAILHAAGSSFEHVVKTTIFLQDMQQFQKVNEIYGSYFKAPFPARATVEVARLPRNVQVEIDCIAQVI